MALARVERLCCDTWDQDCRFPACTLLHEGGYSVRRLMDGGYEFKTPAGRVIPTAAPAMHGGVEDLRIANQLHGVSVSAETGASQLDGSPVDYHHV